MVLYGNHGTSKYKAEQIMAGKFKVHSGRRGTGIYFWRKDDYSYKLSKYWFKFTVNQDQKKEEYSKPQDLNFKVFACINARIEVQEEHYLNIETLEFIDKIKLLIKNYSRSELDEDMLNGVYDLLITMYENERQTSVKVILTRTNNPRGMKEYPYKAIGQPFCYLVKDVDTIIEMEMVN